MDNSQEKKKHSKDKNLVLISYSQAFPEAIDQCLKKGFVVGDCLKDVPICSDVANGPLTKSCAAQPENVTENKEEKKFQFSLERAEMTQCQVGSLCLDILGHQIKASRKSWMVYTSFSHFTSRQTKGELCNLTQSEKSAQAAGAV